MNSWRVRPSISDLREIFILPALLGDGGWVLVLRWPLILALLLPALAAPYRCGPDREDAEWMWVSPGAVLAGLGILAGMVGFSRHAAGFGSNGATHGSLAAVVILLLWLWLSTLVVLAWANLNAVLDRRVTVRRGQGLRAVLLALAGEGVYRRRIPT